MDVTHAACQNPLRAAVPSVEYEAREEAERGCQVNAICAIASGIEGQVTTEADLGGESPPEIDAAGERGERVTAKQAFFNRGHDEKSGDPQCAEANCRRGGQC